MCVILRMSNGNEMQLNAVWTVRKSLSLSFSSTFGSWFGDPCMPVGHAGAIGGMGRDCSPMRSPSLKQRAASYIHTVCPLMVSIRTRR